MRSLTFLVIKLSRRMWPKVSLFALAAALSALCASLLRNAIPEDWIVKVGADTVDAILNILASSMLAVTTFSLTVTVSAYAAASSGVSPRATQLLVRDSITQNVLSVFLGAFIFSLVGIICLNTGIYQGGGRFILMIFTLALIVLIVVTFILWIEHITQLGRVGATARLVEQAASVAMRRRRENPCMGGRRLDPNEADPPGLVAVRAPCCGYIQFVDIRTLDDWATRHDTNVRVKALPGAFVVVGDTLATVAEHALDRENWDKAFAIEDERAFEDDPRFGLCVLAEIAARALPPAINDSGTAIDIISRLYRVLSDYAGAADQEPVYSRTWVPSLMVADLFEDAFDAIARGGREVYEVQARLQKILMHLARLPDPAFHRAAIGYSDYCMRQVALSSMLDEEKKALGAMSASVAEPGISSELTGQVTRPSP